MKNGKRILAVQIRYIADSDPDTSYLEQDGFEDRLRQYRNGLFDYIGIRAHAESGIPQNPAKNAKTDSGVYIVQNISSGGLWGIESDSDRAYLETIEVDELADLKTQLTALGFSKRAISKAFQNIERKDS